MLRMLSLLGLGAALGCASPNASSESVSVPVTYLAPGAEPPDARAPVRTYGLETLRTGKLDHVLHGVGPMWNPREVEGYVNAFPATPPMLVRMGVNLAPTERVSFDDLVDDLRGYMQHHATRLPVLSISFRASLGNDQMRGLGADVTAGHFDTKLDQLVELVRQAGRPVFLRIAPEVNVPKIGHQPREFVKAYRYIVERFRAAGVENAIHMWSYKALRDVQPDFELWYPGDAWVDWWSIDIFYADLSHTDLRARVVDFLRDARARGKPVMLPEAAPSKLDIHDRNTWRLWFQPFFDLIRRYPVIRAFCYSNRDFREHVGLENWGDMRLEGTPMAPLWEAQLRKSIYLHAPLSPRAAAEELDQEAQNAARRAAQRARRQRGIEG
ncbi:MAG: hypothetical protein DHS20C15_32780 [Planctomycetota bacterium]|nr:MAG: hypothetical protein DHS20C15_32780 [Planctomycetota bacterium]